MENEILLGWRDADKVVCDDGSGGSQLAYGCKTATR